jgi:hypothetical protein
MLIREIRSPQQRGVMRNKNRKKILSRISSSVYFFFGIYKYFIIWPQEDFSAVFFLE